MHEMSSKDGDSAMYLMGHHNDRSTDDNICVNYVCGILEGGSTDQTCIIHISEEESQCTPQSNIFGSLDI